MGKHADEVTDLQWHFFDVFIEDGGCGIALAARLAKISRRTAVARCKSLEYKRKSGWQARQIVGDDGEFYYWCAGCDFYKRWADFSIRWAHGDVEFERLCRKCRSVRRSK